MRPRTRALIPHRALCVVVACLLAVPAGGSAVDDFFETDFDGNWVGTLDLGADTVPVQASLNVEQAGGTALVRMPDAETGELRLFAATFRKVKARRLILEYEDAPEEDGSRAEAVTVTLILRFKAASGAIQGKAKGGLRGRIVLEPTTSDLPLGRLWTGTVRLGGESRELLMQLTETEEDGARAAANEVTGWARLGQQQGSVEGTRTGKAVDLTLELDGADATADLRLARKDSQLKGKIEQDGAGTRAKLVPAGSNNGKPMKLRKVSPAEVAAGATTAVTVRGKNFGPGTTVHTDDPAILAGTPRLDSPRSLEVEITVPDGTPEGTAIALRVLNGDGQAADKVAALTVSGSGGGGPAVSFAGQVEPIFAANCALAGCHSAASAQEGLVLAPGQAFANIVNVSSSQNPALNRITPGNPDDSYLVMKIRGAAGIRGSRMPLGRPPLTAEQIQTIVDWVLEGAQNNAPSR